MNGEQNLPGELSGNAHTTQCVMKQECEIVHLLYPRLI